MKKVQLLEIASLSTDRVQPFLGTRPYLATGSVGEEQEITPVDVTYEGRPSRADLCIQTGDVCFARMQGTKKIIEFEEKHNKIILSTGFAIFRPDTKLLYPGFLRRWLSSGEFQYEKDLLCTGATQKAITNEKIALLKIPLPPLSKQRRIADILDKADALRSKRRTAITQLDELAQSIFIDMFGDPVTNPKGWPLKKLCDIGELNRGISKHRPRNAS